MKKLRISLFITFQAHLGYTPIQGFKSDKARALLAYLALEPNRPHARSSLAGLLWPDLPEQTAHGNLRSVLANLRLIIEKKNGLASPVLLADYQTIQLIPGTFECDATAFESHILAGRLKEAAAGYPGRLLQEFYSGSSPFDDWQQMRAETLHQHAMQVFSSQIRDNLQAGHIATALQLSQRQVELDPTNEETHHNLIYLLAKNGQRSTALKQFDLCRQMLTRELGVNPSAEVQILKQAIQKGQELPLPKLLSAKNQSVLAPNEPLVHLAVARNKEIGILNDHLTAVLNGQGKTIFVTGDAGSGKTSLVEAFVTQATRDHPELLTLSSGCSIHNGLALPFLPFREIFLELTRPGEYPGRFARAITNAARPLNQANQMALKLLNDVAPDLSGHLLRVTPPIDPAQRKETGFSMAFQQGSMFQQAGNLLESLSRKFPLLIALDDMQWIDAESLNLFLFLGQRLKDAPILFVGVYRLDEVAAGQDGKVHPLERCVNEFERLFGDICLDLNQSDGKEFVEEYLNSIPNRFRPEFQETLFQHTGGHALFTVEMVESLQKMGYLRQDTRGRWVERQEIDWSRLPARVEAIITQRIKRLPIFWQNALAAASVEGERFTAEALALVLESKPSAMVKGLSRIAGRQHGLIDLEEIRIHTTRRITTFRFRHFIYQQFLYQHLSASERPILHEAVGAALEQVYEDGSDLALIAPQLAYHFEQSRHLNKAAAYTFQTGHAAMQASAFTEARKHLNRAYDLQRGIAHSIENDRLGLNILADLSLANLILHGWGSEERQQVLLAAHVLAVRCGDPGERLLVISQLAGNILGSGQMQQAIDKSRELEELAEQAGEKGFTVLAHMIQANALIFLGRLTTGLSMMEDVLVYIDEHRDDPLFGHYNANEEIARIFYSLGLLVAGRVDEAQVQLDRALDAARRCQSPLILGVGLTAGGVLQSVVCEDHPGVTRYAAELRANMARREYQIYLPWMEFLDGWSDFHNGRRQTALGQLLAWADTWKTKARSLGHPFLLRTLADLLRQAGRAADADSLLDRILLGIKKDGGTNLLEADLLHMRGECQLGCGDERAAEASFRKAIDVAEEQGARFFQIRAANSLCQLKIRQGEPDQAAATLGQIYQTFCEGRDSAPLRTARLLLETAGTPARD